MLGFRHSGRWRLRRRSPRRSPRTATTRIETRPFYGATVTLEEGVRVFRPLPRHDRVIINPGADATSLGYIEVGDPRSRRTPAPHLEQIPDRYTATSATVARSLAIPARPSRGAR